MTQPKPHNIHLVDPGNSISAVLENKLADLAGEFILTTFDSLDSQGQEQPGNDPDLLIIVIREEEPIRDGLFPEIIKRAAFPVLIYLDPWNDTLADLAMEKGALDCLPLPKDQPVNLLFSIRKQLFDWKRISEVRKLRNDVPRSNSNAEAERIETDIERLRLEKQELIEESNSKSEFLAKMSHDLRSPLHAILSFSKFGIDKYDSSDREKIIGYFNKIKESGKKLQRLLDGIVDLSKLESGKMRYQMHTCTLSLLLESLVKDYKEQAEARNLILKTSIEYLDLSVRCDQNKMMMVVRTLLENAITSSVEDGEILIELNESAADDKNRNTPAVMASFQYKAGHELQVDPVKDFTAFLKHEKLKSGVGIIGIYLSITNEIIKHHNGKFWAENRDEGELAFCFSLPASNQ